MIAITNQIQIPDAEIEWAYSRSGGPGGQNVNKVASKAQLRWAMANSLAITEIVKQRLRTNFPSRVTTEGDVLVESQKTRDQERNKLDCVEKLTAMIRAALVVPKPRAQTKPTKASQRRRLADKQHAATRRSNRSIGNGD